MRIQLQEDEICNASMQVQLRVQELYFFNAYPPADIVRKKCFTVRILQVLHHKFVLHDRENLPCKVPKGKHS